MGLKDIKDFTADEVGLWLTAQGINSSKAIEEKVDGDLLLSLTAEDFKSDLGLSGLQSKKIMKNIEFSKYLTQPGGEDIANFSSEEVGMWMASMGLDPSVIVAEGVDGKLLLDLSAEDMKSDLGLSGLQAKKVINNIEYSQSLNGAAADAPENTADEEPAIVEEAVAEEEIIEERAVEEEIVEPEAVEEEEVIEEPEPEPEPEPVEEEAYEEPEPEPEPVEEEVYEEEPDPVPEQAPVPEAAPEQTKTGGRSRPLRGAIKGGATGAAGGAALGAIAAKAAGKSAADGAKAGAAVGAAAGGGRAILGAGRERRQARRAGRQ